MKLYQSLQEVISQIDSPLSIIQTLFEESPLGKQIYRADGRSIYVNAAFLRIFGVAPPAEYSVLEDEIAEKAGVLPLIKKAFAGEVVNLPTSWYDPGELKSISVTGGNRVAIDTKCVPIFNAQRQVTHVMFTFHDVTAQQTEAQERQKVLRQLNDANSLIQDLMNRTRAVIYFQDLDGVFLLVNRQFQEIFNAESSMVVGKSNHQIFPKHVADVLRKNDLEVVASNTSHEFEETIVHADGSTHTYISLKFPLADSEGKVIGLCGISTDITDSRKVEQELQAARRMEALGVLAGGIAHDFNNILGVILLHAEILPGAEKIVKSAHRASDLTRKLLAFGRRQTFAPQVLDLNAVILGMKEMLESVIGEDIEVQLDLDDNLGTIRSDPTQLEQILVNLSLNARDAMLGGGKLKIVTRNAIIDQKTKGRLKALPGEYVELSIQDTGHGIPLEIQDRVFEPFFTTKGKDRGTGLGLSSVYGILQQSGGDIRLESRSGIGTTFQIYFPLLKEAIIERTSDKDESASTLKGTELVLVIDDEPDLRDVTASSLRTSGYQVLEARNAQEAMAMVQEQKDAFDLIVTDVIMPGLNGPAMVDELKKQGLLKNTKVLFISGYSDNKLESSGLIHGSVHFLEKPFGARKLLEKIRDILRPSS